MTWRGDVQLQVVLNSKRAEMNISSSVLIFFFWERFHATTATCCRQSGVLNPAVEQGSEGGINVVRDLGPASELHDEINDAKLN